MTNSEHDHYDAFGVNTKNSFNTPPREMTPKQLYAVEDESEDAAQEPSDQELVNLALSVSSKCQWDGLAICAVFLEALTDANFHMLRERLEDAIKKELKIKSLYSIKE